MEDKMKVLRWFLPFIILGNAALAGCGTYSSEHPYLRAQDADTEKMAKVEAYARRAGIEVHWINYPQKKEP
jgi:hypothetical protein